MELPGRTMKKSGRAAGDKKARHRCGGRRGGGSGMFTLGTKRDRLRFFLLLCIIGSALYFLVCVTCTGPIRAPLLGFSQSAINQSRAEFCCEDTEEGWEKEVQRTTDGTPRVMSSLRSPSATVPLAPQMATNRMTPNQTQKSEQVSECKEMWKNNWSSSIKKKRYPEDYYLQIVGKLQNCTWKKKPQEYAKFKSELASCCDAVHNFIASQNNTPLGINMSYEVDNKKTIHITKEIFRMLPESQPLEYPFKHCAVVGNGGILKNSSCGAEIDKSDFVFRCNLPPTLGSFSQDVGNKTNLVTINPSIITEKYNKLNERKHNFLENVASYGDVFLLLPAFSFRANTAISFKVHHTLREVHAKQKTIFFYPRYLKSLAQYWRTKGVKAYRLSTGFMITSAAVELCENVKLYGFWPFSKSLNGTPISHHYYDNRLPKPGFHAMPKEYNQILQLHGRGILKLQLGKCLTD